MKKTLLFMMLVVVCTAIKAQTTVLFNETSVTVDGVKDDVYTTAIEIETVIDAGGGPYNGDADIDATFYMTWNNDYLNIFVEVTDDTITFNSPEALFDDDGVEIYLDFNNAKSETYDADDSQISFTYPTDSSRSGQFDGEVIAKFIDTDAGYNFECSIDLSEFKVNFVNNKTIGFDIHINDDDGEADAISSRDSKLTWNATVDDAWQNASLFGEITFTGNDSEENRMLEEEEEEEETGLEGFDGNIFKQTSGAIILDGELDAFYENEVFAIESPTLGDGADDENDLSATFTITWTTADLFVFIDVKDQLLLSNSTDDLFFQDDNVEIYLDGDNSKSGAYDQNDYQITLRWNDPFPHVTGDKVIDGLEWVMISSPEADGYHVEAKIPLAALEIDPTESRVIGYDVMVTDDDIDEPESDRELKLAFFADNDLLWNDTGLFGEIGLQAVQPGGPISSAKNDFGSQKMLIAPNPLSGNVFNLSFKDVDTKDAFVYIYGSKGELLKELELNGQKELAIARPNNLSSLSYIVFQGSKENFVQKLIVD